MQHARKRVKRTFTQEEKEKRLKLANKIKRMNQMFIAIRHEPSKSKDPFKFCQLMTKLNSDLPSNFNFRRELI